MSDLPPPEFNVQRQGGTVRYTGPITGVGVNTMLDALAASAGFLAAGFSTEPLQLVIYSCGGDGFAGLMGYEALRHLPTPVHAIATGFVASAAASIFLGAERRSMYPSAMLMLHGVQYHAEGKLSVMEDEADGAEKMDHIVRGIYRERTKLTKKDLKRVMRRDLYFTADEALEYGIVHAIEEAGR